MALEEGEADTLTVRSDLVAAFGRPLIANVVLGEVLVRALRNAGEIALTGDKRKFLQLVTKHE